MPRSPKHFTLAKGRPPPSSREHMPLVFGEVLFDHFPDGTRVLGGAPFNVAWHLKGLGLEPRLVSAVGDDEPGREVLDRMDAWGLDTSGMQFTRRHPTGRVVVTPGDGENSFDIPPEQAWDFVDRRHAEKAAQATPPLLYHGTLALRHDTSWRALKGLAGGGVPSFVDLNLRDPWSTDDRIRWCLLTARWLKLNEHELARVTGAPTGTAEACEQAARTLGLTHKLHQVIVTRGAAGVLCVSEDGATARADAPPVADLVDTVGAGDAVSAVMCVGLLRGWPMDVTLTRAVALAGDICRIRGATTSNLETYERHVRDWEAHETAAPGPRRAEGLYVLSLSVHGLLRSTNVELGRDVDTGGQITYVVDQARALAAHADVDRVDLVTRLVEDTRVDPSYSRPIEGLSKGAQIVRLPFGPARYLHKESLWPYLDELVDELTRWIRRVGRVPDVVHGHYADAGRVGAELAKVLGVPFVFTGHSLGRIKRARLIAGGKDGAAIEERYHLRTRIEAEERALETANIVITSTRQEVDEQYVLYDHYHPDGMRVIPPGVDVSRFSPPGDDWQEPAIALELARFLADPDKPMIFAIARPDERKNFEGLIEAFAMSAQLRSQANLVVVAGNRDDIADMPGHSRGVLTRILLLIDRYDLYGSVAYPKAHDAADVPELYRLVARSGGVFVNPALTEPFGLTLLEAAASGVPIVATNDGGPREIVATCQNGRLVDATDPADIGRGLEEALSSTDTWKAWAANGLAAVDEHYSWASHARRYVHEVQRVLASQRWGGSSPLAARISTISRLLVVDLDDARWSDAGHREALMERADTSRAEAAFCVVTGRTLEQALDTLGAWKLRPPDMLITGTGTSVHYGAHHIVDQSWERQIRYRWDRDTVEQVLADVTTLTAGNASDQTPYRLRYTVATGADVSPHTIRRLLRKHGVHATAIGDRGGHIDVIPVRASPELALRYVCFKWNVPADGIEHYGVAEHVDTAPEVSS